MEGNLPWPFRVLLWDGGGMRGAYQAAYLRTFADRIRAADREAGEVDVGRAFDLIVGTSTGGIVACALAAGVRLDLVRQMYAEAGGKIFPYQRLRRVPYLGSVVRFFGMGLKQGNRSEEHTSEIQSLIR